jgi:putative oxidoreductase
MDMLAKLGRPLFAMVFVIFGLLHLAMGGNMVGVVPAWVPGPAIVWVYLTGIAMVAAAISLFTGKQEKLASALLGVLLLIFALTIQLPAVMGGDQMAMPSLLKDLALAGAAFFFSAQAKA